jgi:hypothetical protein
MDGSRKALIVANGVYDNEGLQQLRSPAADAAALADVLGDPAIGQFDVVVVEDKPAYEVQGHIEDLFSDSRPDDLVLLHLSCHGLKSDSGELFFAMRNTRPDRLVSSAVPADFVQRCIRASRARSVVLLLDCCYGGAYGRGVAVRGGGEAKVLDSFPQQRLGSGRGRAVITASSAIEYAFEGGELADANTKQPSVFTSALVRGLRTGEADQDEDGQVSLSELYDYVFDKVREQNPNQTPSRDIEMQGELYLARSQRRRIKPAAMPPDLDAAVHDANMYSRIGAIGELRARLLGDNLPAAAGAHEALVELARTDIAHVAELAEEADHEAAVRPDTTEIHFDGVVAGAPSPHRTVALLGPPIARACTPVVSDDWLVATIVGSGVDVAIDTGTTGRLQGTLTLRAATGEVVIPVDADVVAVPAQREAAEPVEEPVEEPVAEEAAEPVVEPVGEPVVEPPAAPAVPEAPTVQAVEQEQSGALPAWTVLWALLPVLSLGLLSPVPLVHAAVRLRSRPLAAVGAMYVVGVAVAIIVPLRLRHHNGYWFPGEYQPFIALAVVLAVTATMLALQLRPRVFEGARAYDSSRSPRRPERSPSRMATPDVPPQLPIVHLVALGVAGSGKTVFVSSMFHTLHVPVPEHAYFLETGTSDRVALSRVFDEVSDTEEPWPRGTRTGESRELLFDCVSFRQGVRHPILRFSYLDYAGELLETEGDSGGTALAELEGSMRSANGLLGMLDGHRVLQYLRNEPAGRRYFRSSLQPMIGMMAGATCPVHLVLTKWDLVRGFGEPPDADDEARLSLVKEALLAGDSMRALVEAHSFGGRVVRLIPVSAVGPDFATIDESGHVVKRSGGLVRPSNVEVPLAAVLPDLFGRVELGLEPVLRAAVGEVAASRAGLAADEAERALVRFQMRPDGRRLREALARELGPGGERLVGMFLDWMTLSSGGPAAGTDPTSLEGARGRVIADFCASVSDLERELPSSLLSSRT